MSNKSKGMNAERELVHAFWKTGEWVACRVAGSGSMHYPSPDIIASNGGKRIVLECKITKDNSQYLTKQEVKELSEFAILFDAAPWIAVRFAREDWKFLKLGDLKETNNNYAVSKELAKEKGIDFNSLIAKGL